MRSYIFEVILSVFLILPRSYGGDDIGQITPQNKLTDSRRRRLAAAPVDILFIIDESDSMSEEQSDVRQRVKEIFNQLPPGSAVGLVGYGRRSGIFSFRPGYPQLHTPLTTDPDQFQAAADDLEATGSYEPAYLALYQSVADDFSSPLDFRGDKYCSILITDERSNGSGLTQSQTINALQGGTNSGMESVFFGITEDEVVQSFERIASETGGAMFRLEDFRQDPSFVLTPVLEACTVAVLDNILLDPATATKIVGESHSVAASVLKIVDDSVIDVGVISDGVIDPQKDVPVSFEVVSGPNAGATGICTENAGCATDSAGQLSFSYVGDGGIGMDEIEACFADSVSGTKKCATVSVEWMNNPTLAPSSVPTAVPAPTGTPTLRPTVNPTVVPTSGPTSDPSSEPSPLPSLMPSMNPSASPSAVPSAIPSHVPSTRPSAKPSASPTFLPSAHPSSKPTFGPSPMPTTIAPTTNPTEIPCPLEKDEIFVLDQVEFPGDTRSCKWLQKPVGDRLSIYCNDPQSSALQDCPLTCGRCDPTQDSACKEEERTATFLRDINGPQDRDPAIGTDTYDPELINVRRCKWLVKGQDRLKQFCPRSTSTAADVCPCNCAMLP